MSRWMVAASPPWFSAAVRNRIRLIGQLIRPAFLSGQSSWLRMAPTHPAVFVRSDGASSVAASVVGWLQVSHCNVA